MRLLRLIGWPLSRRENPAYVLCSPLMIVFTDGTQKEKVPG